MYHPDRNKSLTARQKFQEIQTAYEILGSLKLRQEYDGMKLPSKTPFVPKVKHPWKTASHPTGRASYNFDEHINQHYSHKLKLHQQIKEDTTFDREDREKRGFHKEEPFIQKIIGIALVVAALLCAFSLLPTYQRKREDQLVKRMLASGQRNDNKINEETSR